MPAVINNPNMGNNTNPVQTPEDIRSKYADYFVTDTNKNLVSIDTFFQLLLAEMTNQDPLEPTTNTEFVSQLASFTALQTNSDSLHYNTVSYASSLAGKTVTVAMEAATTDENGKTVQKTDTGVVTNVDISDDDEIQLTVNGKKYALKDIIYVSESGSSSTSGASKTDGAYAVSLIGKKALVTGTNEDGEKLLDEGIVESVEYQDGAYRAVVNGLSYSLDDIVRVRDADVQTASAASADGAYAVSLIGKNVLISGLSEDGEETYGEGVVDSIEVVDGEYRVVIGEYAFSLSDVVSISNPDISTDTDNKTEPEITETENTETSIMDENEELMKLFS